MGVLVIMGAVWLLARGVEACRPLDVSTELDRLSETLQRESRRLRTEAGLQRAGVDLG